MSVYRTIGPLVSSPVPMAQTDELLVDQCLLFIYGKTPSKNLLQNLKAYDLELGM